jgi:ABC-2 type transport system permease protein
MPIFDQGYQHWRGPLSGHVWRWITIARQGVRVQRKSWMVFGVLLLAWLPALGLVGAMVTWGLVERKSEGMLAIIGRSLPPDLLQDPHAYRIAVWTVAYSLFFKVEMYFIMLLVAIAGPGLISQDLRFNALPLYFARPLTRLDYFLGKLGVIGALVASVAVGPALLAYIVGVCFCLDLSVIKDTYPVLLGSLAYGLIVTLSVGTLVLALSSLTRRTLYVGITWAGLWLISASVGGLLTAIHGESVRRELYQNELYRWIATNPPPPGVQLYHGNPSIQFNPKSGKYRLVGVAPGQEEEGERWHKEWGRASQQAWTKAQREQSQAVRHDWRPMCSYVANLERMADLLLDTDSAWVNVGGAVERARRAAIEKQLRRSLSGSELPAGNERELADRMVMSYPWWWSAAVLASLLGVSTWILTRRIKSLDRLR